MLWCLFTDGLPSLPETSWSESHLSVLRWIMSGATLGTKVRTEQLSKHGSGYQFQPGCWPHLSVNTGTQVQTDPAVNGDGESHAI